MTPFLVSGFRNVLGTTVRVFDLPQDVRLILPRHPASAIKLPNLHLIVFFPEVFSV